MAKIGFVHSVSVVGGAERMSQAIMEGLPNYKFESQLFCPSVGEFPETLKAMNINSSNIEMFQPSIKHPIRSIKHYLKWRRLIHSEKIDILHTGDLICARSLLKAANSLDIPVICHMHFPVQEDFVSWVFKGLPKPFGFVFCSQELQNDVGELLQKYCPDTKQWVVHNGVDVNKFSHPYSENPTPQIGIIANLQQRKGHDDFLQMASILKEQGVVASYEIIGGDILQEPREPYLKNKTKELELEHCVNFHGQVNNVQQLLNQLDIFVCASHQEAFPVSILEAMASTKAIVSTNVNGIPEAIVDGESGILVEAHEPEQLAKAVKSLIDDPPYRKTLATNARKRVEDKFSNTVYLESVVDIYKQALSQ